MSAKSLGQAAPPWHLWGNTQVFDVRASAFTNPNANDNNQTMVRIAYGRPETWRFLLAYKILAAPSAPVNQANISVWFEMITGHGRAAVRLPFWATMQSSDWSGGSPPLNLMIFTTRASGDSAQSIVNLDNGGTQIFGTASLPSDQVVGQDITVKANMSFTTDLPLPQTAKVEVSCLFAPNSHVRPDWYRIDEPEAVQFPGGEVGSQ